MHLAIIPLFLALASWCPSATSARHIVFIVADDLGWNDVGFHNSDMITPNIDRLAAAGVILNNSYVQPLCTPSRHAFMTGVYPFKAGRQRGVIMPTKAQCSPLTLTFLPERMKALGYATHMVGKWHLGSCSWNCTPTYRGFDTFLGYYNGMEDYYTKTLGLGADFRDVQTPYNDSRYSAEVYAERAVDIIGKHDGNIPLFLYLPFQSVHSPIQVPQEYENMYPNVDDQQRRRYCGMVTAMDEAIGNVTRALENAGLIDDTLIIFTTDNGGAHMEGGNNYPLRGGKGTVYEGGTRAAAFVYGSGLEHTGKTYDGIMHVVDWHLTILAAAGGETVSTMDGVNQWESITSGAESQREEFVYNIDEQGDRSQAAIRVGDYKLIQGYPGRYQGWDPSPEISTQGSVFAKERFDNRHEQYNIGSLIFRRHGNAAERMGDSEFSNNNQETVHEWDNQPELGQVSGQSDPDSVPRVLSEVLFNLRDDPTEHNDIAEEHPEIVRDLRARLDEHRKSLVPPDIPDDDPRSDPQEHGGYWSPWGCTL